MAFDFPASPTTGQIYNAPTGQGYIWNGTAWDISARSPQAPVASDTPPANPYPGQLWLRGTTGALYMWYDDGNSQQWIQIPGSNAAPGIWELIEDVNIPAAGITNYIRVGMDAYEFVRVTGSLCPVASTTPFNLYVTENGGTSWVSDANAYFIQLMYGSGTTVAGSGASSTAISLSASNTILPGVNSDGCNFILNLMRFNKSGYMRGKLDTDFQNNSSQLTTAKASVGTQNTHTVPRNGICIQGTGGSVAFTGHFFVEGVRG